MTHISVNGDPVHIRIGDIFRLGDEYWQVGAILAEGEIAAENLRDSRAEYFHPDLLDANNMYTKYSQATR